MAIQLYVHDGSALAAVAGVVGTAVPVNTKRVIRAATICNNTAGAVPCSVWMVPATGAPDATNIMISEATRVLAPGESYPCSELINQGLNAGGTVQARGAGLTFKYTATDFT